MKSIIGGTNSISKMFGISLFEQSAKEIFEGLDLAFWICDYDNIDSWISSGVEEITGYSQDYFIQTPTFWRNTVVHEYDRDFVRETYDKLKQSHSFNIEYRINTKRNEVKWIRERAIVVLQNGVPTHDIGIIEDITDKKLIEMELQQSEVKYRSLVEHSQMGVYILKNNRFFYVNSRIVEITGYSQEELLNQSFTLLLDEEGQEIARQRLYNYKNGIENENKPQILRIKRKDGGSIYVELRSTLIENGIDLMVSGSVLDITERKKNEEVIQYLAFHDPQTGLRTRTSFYDRLDSVIMSQRGKLLVMFIDLDKFKMINDQYGHHVGDELIKAVSSKIQNFVGNRGEVGRYGGDEFVLFLSVDNVNIDRIMLLANYLQNELSSVSIDGVKDLAPTPSIGISIFPDHGTTSDDLIRYADTAMYSAKKGCSDHVKVFTTEMDQINRRKAKLTQDLYKALEKGELFLVYQPIISLEDKKIIKNEALLRWKHSEYGLISPNEFIPIAEESDLINKIGYWVLETACQQTSNWIKSGHEDLMISVNLSVRQLKQEDFIEQLIEILNKTKLAPHSLNLEITESASIHNIDYTLSVLGNIKKLGISLSLDDFGTGYSSLSYLSKLPIDHLKIDKSFIMEIEENPFNKPIVHSILRVAESLQIQTVAEGVETEGHAALLLNMGCAQAQGFYFSRPLPVDEIEAFMHKSK